MYLEFTDQCDPDYSPPVLVMAAMVGVWMAVAGVVVVVNSCVTRIVGEKIPWLGLCLVALGIAKLFMLDIWSLEWWQAYFLDGVRLGVPRGEVPVIGVISLSLGFLLCLQSMVFRVLRAEQDVDDQAAAVVD